MLVALFSQDWLFSLVPFSGAALLPRGVIEAARPGFISTGDGTWVWQNPLPQGNDLGGISCPSLSTCLAVGSAGTILGTWDGGQTWTVRSSGTTHFLVGISCSSLSTCLAVGFNGTILLTRNGGHIWTVRSSGTTNRLSAISCPNLRTCCVLQVILAHPRKK